MKIKTVEKLKVVLDAYPCFDLSGVLDMSEDDAVDYLLTELQCPDNYEYAPVCPEFGFTRGGLALEMIDYIRALLAVVVTDSKN